MTAFLIIIIICLITGAFISSTKAIKKAGFNLTAKGSRLVELEEFDKWARVLVPEYKEIANCNHPFDLDEARNRMNIHKRYSDHGVYFIALSGWNNREALDLLITRYNLPTNQELNLYYNQFSGYENYASLAHVLAACAKRSIKQRGYNYGAIDYNQLRTDNQLRKKIENKYPRI
ncbi:MAG: hypothetical protein LBH47_03890 [Christensenellaceae bacterium]|jgi:hypothetical protein|nr:hypothetical protein [Christensenellaceae bacterium]